LTSLYSQIGHIRPPELQPAFFSLFFSIFFSRCDDTTVSIDITQLHNTELGAGRAGQYTPSNKDVGEFKHLRCSQPYLHYITL